MGVTIRTQETNITATRKHLIFSSQNWRLCFDGLAEWPRFYKSDRHHLSTNVHPGVQRRPESRIPYCEQDFCGFRGGVLGIASLVAIPCCTCSFNAGLWNQRTILSDRRERDKAKMGTKHPGVDWGNGFESCVFCHDADRKLCMITLLFKLIQGGFDQPGYVLCMHSVWLHEMWYFPSCEAFPAK